MSWHSVIKPELLIKFNSSFHYKATDKKFRPTDTKYFLTTIFPDSSALHLIGGGYEICSPRIEKSDWTV